MSFAIGNRVEVITTLYLGRWIYPLEKGIVVRIMNIKPYYQDEWVNIYHRGIE